MLGTWAQIDLQQVWFTKVSYCVILDVSFMLPISSVAEGEGTRWVVDYRALGTYSGHDCSFGWS